MQIATIRKSLTGGLLALFALLCAQIAMVSSAYSQATQVPPGEVCFQATTGINGLIGTLGSITAGSGGTAGTYVQVPLTGGNGSGATANVTVSGGGAVTAVVILSPGIQYAVGDVLSAASGNIGGVTGFSVTVASISINSALAGGSVGMYVPSTLTYSQTWQNAAQTILNTNPIQLDSNGCAVIYGIGTYRQIVYDSLGNAVWDKLTSVAPVNPYWAGNATGTSNAVVVTDGSFSGTDGQIIQFVASFTNTGPVTLTVNPSFGTAPILVNTSSGPVALGSGAIVAGNVIEVVYSTRYGAFITNSTIQTNNYPVIDVIAYGAVGDGITVNNAALQAAYSAASVAGGMIRFPCGKFKVTTTITASIPANQNITIMGSGQECTQFYASASNGMAATYGNPFSSFELKDMSVLTDQAGGFTGLNLVLSTGVASGQSAGDVASTISHVTFRGNDLSGAHTEYWGSAFTESGVSAINVIGGECDGAAPPSTLGNCYSLNGNIGVPFYSTALNFNGTFMNNCNLGISYGDFVQGVTLDAVNMTGCARGVTTPVTPTGTLAQLSVVNSQFNTTICGVCINDTNTGALGFVGLFLTNDLFIIEPGGTGLILNGTAWHISNNEFDSVGVMTAQNGIFLAGNAAAGGIINDNTFNALLNAIDIAAGVTSAQAFIKHNHFFDNTHDYLIGSGAGAIVIDDDLPRVYATLPACTTAIQTSRFLITDSPTATFNAAITTGGSTNQGVALCLGAGGLVFR